MKTERQFILPKEPENSCGALYESGKSRGRYNSLSAVSFGRLVSLGLRFIVCFHKGSFAKNSQKSGREGIEEARDIPQIALESLYSDPTSPKYRGRDSPQENIS